MGYPMTYKRVVSRNRLDGDYGGFTVLPNEIIYERKIKGERITNERAEHDRWQIAGDLRRMEEDTRDANHLAMYASISGATIAQVKTIFDEFFKH